MTKIISSFSGSLAIVAGAAFVLTMGFFVSSPLAHAESPDVLVGSNLMMGSSGQGVVVLQGLLTEMGYLNVPAGTSYGYYGPLTRDAMTRYQNSQSVSPTVGYYGPVTKVAMFNDFASRGWLNVLGWND